MRIIEQRTAPNPRRVRIFLAEKGITVPTEQIDIMKLEHRSSAFTDRNPVQQVPVLIFDDGGAIAESVAICRYFEETQPEPVLMGRGARDKATVEMWNRRVEHGLFSRVAQCFRHTHPAMAELEKPQIKEWAEANRARALESLAMLDRELAGRPFIAGDTLTIADITALVAVDFMRAVRIERPRELAHLDRWYQSVSTRPSAKA